MTEELTDYQKEIVDSTGKNLMVASRQSGKTEVIAERSTKALNGEFGDTTVVGPQEDMIRRIRDRVREKCHDARHTTHISKNENATVKYYSSNTVEYRHISGKENLIIDEANYVDPSFLYEINKDFRGNIILTATPRPRNTFVKLWAKHAYDWKVHHVPMSEVPFVDKEHRKAFSESLSTEQTLLELEAAYDL